MGLESGNRIEDLDVSFPLAADLRHQGDDHLRLIKACVAGSFPSLGATAVSVTAPQINDVTNKLVSFAGRTVVAAVPASDDYELMDENSIGLGDVNVSTPLDHDFLRYDSASGKWVNFPFIYGYAHFEDHAGNSADSTYFATQVNNTYPAALATITNTSGGWLFTPAMKQIVTMTFTAGFRTDGGVQNTDAAIARNPVGTTIPGASDHRCVAFAQADTTASGGTDIVLSATFETTAQTIRVYDKLHTGSRDVGHYKLTISSMSVPP